MLKKASSHGALRHSGHFWLCQLLYALFDIKASKKLWGQVGNESWSPYLNHQTAEICRASVSAGYSSDGDDFSACFIFSRTYFIQMRTFIRSANDTAIHNLTGNNSPPILFITLIGNLICSELFIGFYIIFHYCYKYYISFFQSLIVFKFLKLFFFFLHFQALFKIRTSITWRPRGIQKPPLHICVLCIYSGITETVSNPAYDDMNPSAATS